MRISYWCSDVCSSDLRHLQPHLPLFCNPCLHGEWPLKRHKLDPARRRYVQVPPDFCVVPGLCGGIHRLHRGFRDFQIDSACRHTLVSRHRRERDGHVSRSEEHTAELQSLMRISYAVFCLKKKKRILTTINII